MYIIQLFLQISVVKFIHRCLSLLCNRYYVSSVIIINARVDTMRCAVLVVVILSVHPFVCHTHGLCPLVDCVHNSSTYHHDFFTIW